MSDFCNSFVLSLPSCSSLKSLYVSGRIILQTANLMMIFIPSQSLKNSMAKIFHMTSKSHMLHSICILHLKACLKASIIQGSMKRGNPHSFKKFVIRKWFIQFWDWLRCLQSYSLLIWCCIVMSIGQIMQSRIDHEQVATQKHKLKTVRLCRLWPEEWKYPAKVKHLSRSWPHILT